jgi:hypothetical protein
LTKTDTFINLEQLSTALEYIIWFEATRQWDNIPRHKRREIETLLSDQKYREDARVLDHLRQRSFPTDVWSHVLGNEHELTGRYVEFLRMLNTILRFPGADFDLESVVTLLEPELARMATIVTESPQAWRFNAILNYFHTFAKGEVTERDLLAA